MGKLETCANVAQIAESVAAIAALFLGGWWFFEQREPYPRADLSQSAQAVIVEPGIIAVEAIVSLKNEGKKQLQLHHANVRLQEVSGEAFDYRALAKLDGTPYWTSERPVDTPDKRQFNDGELRWPVLKVYNGNIDYHVEPGETDTMVFSFLVPCSRVVAGKIRRLRVLRIATDIARPDIDEDRSFAWKTRAFLDVSEQCRK